MTTHLDTTERDAYLRAHTTDGLDLFNQRVAAPEVEAENSLQRNARIRREAQMPGAGQAARADARMRAQARGKMEATYARLALCLEAHGPLTRKELAEVSGVPVNTVNARISEMRAFLPMGEDPLTWPYAVYTEGRRNGESIVHLARLKP